MSRHLETGRLDELTVTTNGSQLRRFATDLFECGVRRINVSLDTLDPDKFARITRWGRLPQVLDGIEKARSAGIRVKINTVALKGFNEDELESLIEWCASNDLDLTFIEVMPMGDIGNENRNRAILVDKGCPCAHRQSVDRLGHCRAIRRSRSICSPDRDRSKNRVHHSAQSQFLRKLQSRSPELCRNSLSMPRAGKVRSIYVSVLRERPDDDEALINAIHAAIAKKPKGHDFDYSRGEIQGQMSRHMSHTGG